MGRRHDYSDALGAIAAPTLMVHGGNDLQPIEVANDYAAWIPNSSVVTIPGSGHFPHYTHGEALAPIVREFLDGLARQTVARKGAILEGALERASSSRANSGRACAVPASMP